MAAETVTLETVTVTARKRAENVQDVPASITTLTDTEIEDAAIGDATDLVAALPNVHMQHNYAENVIIIRGLSSFNTSIYSPAGVYVDDVAYPLHYMHNPEFFDIERIEVLKGPQGTLYAETASPGSSTSSPGSRETDRRRDLRGIFQLHHLPSWRQDQRPGYRRYSRRRPGLPAEVFRRIREKP